MLLLLHSVPKEMKELVPNTLSSSKSLISSMSFIHWLCHDDCQKAEPKVHQSSPAWTQLVVEISSAMS